jgi:hypothetical protein
MTGAHVTQCQLQEQLHLLKLDLFQCGLRADDLARRALDWCLGIKQYQRVERLKPRACSSCR